MAAQTSWLGEAAAVNHSVTIEIEDAALAKIGLDSDEHYGRGLPRIVGNSAALRITEVVNFTGRVKIMARRMECEKGRLLHSGNDSDESEISGQRIKFGQVNSVATLLRVSANVDASFCCRLTRSHRLRICGRSHCAGNHYQPVEQDECG